MLDIAEVVESVAPTEEVAPICEKHGVGKLWQRSQGHKQGGYWVCSDCRQENRARYRNSFVGRTRSEVHSREQKTKVHSVRGYTATGAQLKGWWQYFRLRLEDVVEMYERQEGKCMFGGEPLRWEEKRIDHDHNHPDCVYTSAAAHHQRCPRDAVRGLSCNFHNLMEGHFVAHPEAYMAVPCWHAKQNGGEVPCYCKEIEDGNA